VIVQRDTSSDPPARRGADVRTFLFADVRGYTRFTHERGDEAASELAARFADVVREAMPAFEGELLELRGDEALCVFSSARQALRAAAGLQRRFRVGADGEPVLPLGVGMGLDAGEAVPTQGGYRGGALNVAARLCAVAGPGEVLAAETVVALARRVEGLRFQPRRAVRVKGVSEPVRLVEVVSEEPLPPLPLDPAAPGLRRRALQSRWRVAAVVTAVVVLACVAVLVSASGSGSQAPAPSVRLRHGSVAVLNPQTGQIVADPRLDLKGDPPHIAAGEGAVWTYSTDAETVYRLDPRTLNVEPLGLGISPTDIATGRGAVWVVDGWDQVLMRVDARSPTVTRKISLPGHENLTLYKSGTSSVAVGRSLIWIAQNNCVCHSLLGISPGALRIRERPSVITAGPIAAQGTALWLQESQSPPVLAELHPGHGTITLSGQGGCCLALSDGSAWYAAGPKVWKISPSTPLTNPDTIHLPANAEGIATGGGEVWVATDTAVVAIDPRTDTTSTPIHLALPPSAVAYLDGKLWLAIA